MKPYPISVQLYSVREEAQENLAAVLKKIADIGYSGVEFAGLYGNSPADVRKMLDDAQLVASSSHGPIPTEENVDEIIETARAIGYMRHVAGFGPDTFATKDSTLQAAETAQKGAELLKGSGVRLGIHNHWFEFDKKFDGKYPHEVFMEAAPDLYAEIDTYWVKVGGGDPVAVVRNYGMRTPLLHIKDGPGTIKEDMTAVGEGIMEWAPIIDAASDLTEWLIVELDRCATDMMTAVAGSYKYLTSHGFAVGKK